MENLSQASTPKKKKMNDFLKLGLGLLIFIAALLLLKYVMGAFHLI
jgi:hypothetical protein